MLLGLLTTDGDVTLHIVH